MTHKAAFRRLPVILLILVPVLLLTAIITNTAAAQEGGRPVTDDEVNEIAGELFCPVCESTPLDVCPTQACADWREIIRTKLAQGETEEQIKDYFVEQYGPRALAEPPQEGFTLAVWVIPIVVVVVGGFFFSRYVIGIQRDDSLQTADIHEPTSQATTSDSPPEPPTDDYAARIEAELKERTK